MASDEDFFVVRKFGPVSARVILMLQDRIQYLSEQLEIEDEKCQAWGMHAGQFRDCSPNDLRLKLLDDLSWNIERYSE